MRKLTQFKQLSFDTHNLLIIVFGTLASIKKIFWFHNFEKIIGYKTRDKTAHVSVPTPSHFVAERKTSFPLPAPAARAVAGLTSEEVSFCAEILTFARTHFARAERVVALD
jgi:hypothetical protein